MVIVDVGSTCNLICRFIQFITGNKQGARNDCQPRGRSNLSDAEEVVVRS